MAQVSKQRSTAGLALATSATGSARTGAVLNLNTVQPGSLSVACQAAITTSSVVATFTPQVSNDQATWWDVKLANNATNVATAAGTGSAVTTSVCLDLGGALGGWKYFRCNATLSGATTASADQTSTSYVYLQYGVL